MILMITFMLVEGICDKANKIKKDMFEEEIEMKRVKRAKKQV